ncbi:uncharacterized protein LOC133872667 [Alnus glutinosa]|uniref:uncharacterized protein LOC133872667 n=1 Tax=Alnus glutinosa TaxID=3517 RepID=UPI002D78E4C0|nr:uncharacterized protein LOC133872667 [Alnus glutinosa]
MASPPEDRPKKESGQSLDTSRNHPLATITGHALPPGTDYTPVIGYPNLNPHVQPRFLPPQAYHGYLPSNACNNGACPYDQPRRAAYYNYPTHLNSSRSSGFRRGCVGMIIIFVFLSFVSAVMAWLILRPEFPVFRVDTFSVSKFNTSDSDFTANWDANVNVENPNHRLKVYFHKIKSWVSYKDNILSSSLNAEPSLFLDAMGHAVLHVKLSTNNSYDDQLAWVKWLEMDQDRNGGSVSYNLRMMVWSTFKRGWWGPRRGNLKVYCDDLEVRYAGHATNNRMLPPGQSRVCTVKA